MQNNLGIPIAIVIAAALVAGAILYNGKNAEPAPGTAPTAQQQEEKETVVAPVTEKDHIRGNPNAAIMIIEYSDYDCPFCKNFHETMKRIMDEYGVDGKVAWVYRHFPLPQLHPNAITIAEAAECVAELGGNDAFWAFSDRVFNERGTNEPTDITRLPEFAKAAGVEEGAFKSCLESNKYEVQIVEDINEAIAAGGQGTPHTIVTVGDQQGVINGAQPYEVVKQVVESLLAQIEGGQVAPTN